MGACSSKQAASQAGPASKSGASTTKKSDETSAAGAVEQPQVKIVQDPKTPEDKGPRAEPIKTTSRGFNKSKGGSTLFGENSGYV
jgi:hypothetical protein